MILYVHTEACEVNTCVCAWILFLLLNTHHIGLSGNVHDLEKGLFHLLVSGVIKDTFHALLNLTD
jgi:hypothetical protein